MTASVTSQLLLARHGQTDSNVEPVTVQGQLDVPLNSVGLEQATQLTQNLLQLPQRPRALYTSTLLRAQQTAEIVGRGLGLQPQLEPRLVETNRGSWQGRKFVDIQRDEPQLYAAWRDLPDGDFCFPDGESLVQQQQRVVAALEEIKATSEKPVVVICHGGSIRLALCHYRGVSISEFHSWDVPNAGVTAL